LSPAGVKDIIIKGGPKIFIRTKVEELAGHVDGIRKGLRGCLWF